MARGRFLSCSISTDKALNDLPIDAEYLFLKTLPHLDRDGLILADDLLLWAKACPRRAELMTKMPELIQAIEDAGIIVTYETSEGRAAWFPNFRKHQVGMRYDREAPSEIEPPPGYIRDRNGLVKADGNDGEDPHEEEIQTPSNPLESPPADEVRHYSGTTPAEVRHDDGDCLAQLEDQDQVKDQDQGEDRSDACARTDDHDTTDHDFDDPPWRAIQALTEQDGLLVVWGEKERTLCVQMAELYEWPQIVAAERKLVEAYRKKRGGIKHPIGYMASILANGMDGADETPAERIERMAAADYQMDEQTSAMVNGIMSAWQEAVDAGF